MQTPQSSVQQAKACEACHQSGRQCSYSSVSRPRGRRPAGLRLQGNNHLRHDKVGHSLLTAPQSAYFPDSMSQTSTGIAFKSCSAVFPDIAERASTEPEYLESASLVSPQSAYIDEYCQIPALELAEEEFISETIHLPDPVWTHAHSGDEDSPHAGSACRPPSCFRPWVRVFLDKLYPIFPVVERDGLLETLDLPREAIKPSVLGFFAAMSAAVIVQLNLDTSVKVDDETRKTSDDSACSFWLAHATSSSLSAGNFVAECLRFRQQRDFIDEADEWTVLESLFLFSYYGNLNNSKAAWFYLRESIGFAISLGMDREESYSNIDPQSSQRRRRLYWLLFITERAYAIQHRASTLLLRASIMLPSVFESSDQTTLLGFVTLARLFAAIEDEFIFSWSVKSLIAAGTPVARLLDPDRFSRASSTSTSICETQRVDITLTQCWLRVLVCQLQGRLGSLGSTTKQCVTESARSLLACFSDISQGSLESHGIGLVCRSLRHICSSVRSERRIEGDLLEGALIGSHQEQKNSDIAGCLCDILPTLHSDQLIGAIDSVPHLLHGLLCLLSNIRNKESTYLEPLASRATVLLAHKASFVTMPSTVDGEDDDGAENVWL